MDIISLYEDLRKHIQDKSQYDDLFYEATEGDAQIDIVKEMLENILKRL